MSAKKIVKPLMAVAIILLVLAVGGLWYLNWMMSQPLYKFGSVQSGENLRGPLQPPEQQDPSVWQVEDDIELSFDEYGEGEPVIVVHGGPGIPYASLWKGLEPLSDRYKFYFYHQRGCGDSTRPLDQFQGNFYENMTELDRTLGLAAQIADIERIRQILGLEKVKLIGHSFGGFLAALYAAEFPDRVDKLVLVAPAGLITPPDNDRDLFGLARSQLDEQQQAKFDEVKAQYFDFANIFSKTDAELAELHKQIGSYVLTAMGYDPSEIEPGPPSGGWAVFGMYFSIGRVYDLRPALEEITAPTLIVHGADDELALAGSRSYEAIAGSTFVLIPREQPEQQAGHFVYDDSPTEFSTVVESFLAEP